MALHELEVGGVRVEPRPQQKRLGEDQHRNDERRLPDERTIALIVADQQQDNGAGDRQSHEGRQNRKRHLRLAADPITPRVAILH